MTIDRVIAFALLASLAACSGGGGGGGGSPSQQSTSSQTTGTGASSGGDSSTGGTTDNPDVGTADDIRFLGAFYVSEFDNNTTALDAGFIRFTQDVSFTELQEAMPKPDDTCTVARWDAESRRSVTSQSGLFTLGRAYEFVSAGAELVVSSQSGTYATLSSENIDALIAYSTQSQSISRPLPTGAVFDIPGDVFPPLTHRFVDDLPVFNLSSPSQGEALTAQSQFTWTAGDIADAVILLDITSHDVTNDITTTVECTAVDDGEFSLPPSTQENLTPLSQTASVHAVRQVTRLSRKDNAVLAVVRQSAD